MLPALVRNHFTTLACMNNFKQPQSPAGKFCMEKALPPGVWGEGREESQPCDPHTAQGLRVAGSAVLTLTSPPLRL